MRVSSFYKRVTGGVTVLAVAGAAALVTTSGASAQTPTGPLTLDPTAGTDITPSIMVTTSAPCPTGSTAFNIRVQGPGGLDNFATNRTTVGFSTTNPITAPFTNNFRDTAAQDTPPVTLTAGSYTVTLQCLQGLAGTVVGTFVAPVIFDTPTAWRFVPPVPPTPVTPPPTPVTPTPTPGVTATTTNLTVFPNPAFEGLPVLLFANVSPNNAAGTVQFRDGNTNIGGPVRVNDGFAFRITFLSRGQHTVTAVFTPDNPRRFGPSRDSERVNVRRFF